MSAEVRVSMFFAGLILLIPHRIGMSRVNYIIKRYNLPISRAGLLLYKFHNPIEVSLFIGNVIGFSFTFGVKDKDDLKKCMIGVTSAMLISSIFLFIIYVSGDDFGHLNAFYITLILITLFDGATNPFAFACNAPNASLYAAGIPISGFLVTLLHNIYKFFSDKYHLDDFDYYVLLLQLFLNILQLSATIVLWANCSTSGSPPDALMNSYNSANDWLDLFKTDHAADWSPIGMLAISLGTVYAFYPSIAPYSIIDYQYASVIELWILSISSSPTLLFAILNLPLYPLGNGSGTDKQIGIGPGSCNYKYDSSGTPKNFGSGYWGQGIENNNYTYAWWHLVWIFVIPYILCIQIFMSLLHYPDCSLSSFFNHHPLIICFISILFNTLREAMQACGFAGAGKQNSTAPNWDTGNTQWVPGNIKGTIASTNKPITLFVMMFCVFTGDGYLQHYRRCCRDSWPTTGYNKYQSFFYWLRYGFKGGIKSFITSFTDLYYHDIRPQIISYA